MDPWRYQVRIERLVRQAQGPFDFVAFADPGRDDMMIATLGWIVELVGGGQYIVGVTLATYPVAVAVIMVLTSYFSGKWITGNRWVGLATATVLAMTPANVYRTALGFGDHHAFDYLWLTVTVAATLYLFRESTSRQEQWVATGAIGVALSAQTLSWVGGVLLVAPYTVFVFLLTAVTFRSERSNLSVTGPLLSGMLVASVLTTVAVAVLSWQTMAVAGILVAQLLFLGIVVGTCFLSERHNLRPHITWFFFLSLAGIITLLLRQYFSVAVEFTNRGLSYFSRTTGSVAEASPLLTGPDFLTTLLSFFGPLWILFLPYLLIGSWRSLRSGNPGWLVVSTYAWYFLGLSLIQRRFTGELSLFFSLIIGYAIVDLVRRVSDLVSAKNGEIALNRLVHTDSRPQNVISNPCFIFLVILVATLAISITVAQVPPTMEDRVVSDAEYNTAREIRAYSETRGWNQSEGYVFSPFDSNLMYNYFAHGQYVRFGYARPNYLQFVTATNEREWFQELMHRGAGFVVVTDEYSSTSENSLQTRLQRHQGSAHGQANGIGHFRLIYRSEDNSTVVYTPVRGALITGVIEPNQTVRVATEVTSTNESFIYERYPSASSEGRFAVVVPYPGVYTVADENITVTDTAVATGRTANGHSSGANWSFDGTHENYVFDSRGGHHAVGTDIERTQGISGSALTLDGDDPVVVRNQNPSGLEARDGLTVSLWFRTDPETDYVDEVPFPRLVSRAPASDFRNTSGYQISVRNGHILGAIGDGPGAARLVGPTVDDGQWHHAALTWNGTIVTLYVDGTEHASQQWVGTPAYTDPLVIGATSDLRYQFTGTIDEVQIYDHARMPNSTTNLSGVPSDE